MIHSVRFTCVLDTNVIYPLQVRDLLFWFAHYQLYTPKWSAHIFDEWRVVMRRKGIPEEEIVRRVAKANRAFPDALVEHYEVLMDSLKLPDAEDRHILAVAIKAHAHVIVTNNVRDFPEPILEPFGLSARSADEFMTDLIDLNQQSALEAFRKMVMNRRDPEMNEFQVLDALRRNNLQQTANYLHTLI